ncbi:MAG: hypothetical protein ACI9JD_003118 [Rhodococcus sp. (in: high G+C Gram-positive bacteria)]|jgi:hypothetical protein
MLRFGTAVVEGTTIAIARVDDDPRYCNVTYIAREIAQVDSLDDILDLSDDLLAQIIDRTRVAQGSINATQLHLLPPLTRAARLRDCGIEVRHLAPSFERIADRVEIVAPEKAAAVRKQFDGLNDVPFDKEVMGGERSVSEIAGDGSVVECLGGELDFELELAAVVRCRPDGTPDLFGYTFFNDWTVRDVQISQFLATGGFDALSGGPAKNFPGSNVIGPLVVLAADVDPAELEISVEVDGRYYGGGTIAGAAWTFPDAIEFLFAGKEIEGHELIGSGTLVGGSTFENGDRVRDGAVVQFRSREIGNLTSLNKQS